MIAKKVKQIIAENLEMKESIQIMNLDLKLIDIGVNSITFIKIIVAIETEFDFEFSDEDLDYNKFPNIDALVSYVKNKIS
ncbi:MAG: acyl carrier protein [Clostridia bacterium]|nr:acyl carrier protein [Clostridia bacterium]